MSHNNINLIFDRVIKEKRLKNDSALSKLLESTSSDISKLRHFRKEPGAAIILALVELGGIPLVELRADIPRKSASAGDE